MSATARAAVPLPEQVNRSVMAPRGTDTEGAGDPGAFLLGRAGAPMDELIWVAVASLLAGLIDAMAGGGGLVLLPSLFAAYPAAAPATLFGTNKGAAIWGTALAAQQYARRVTMPWATLLPAAGAAFAGSAAGAFLATRADAQTLRQLLPVLLILVLADTLRQKNLGQAHAPRLDARREALVGCAIGGAVGLYDGVFGPGTGSFFVFLFVRLLGFDFLHASASAKLLNTTTNASALLLFASQGHVWWKVVAVLAVTNMIGSRIGTRLALRHGSALVRRVFIAVVGVLILKTAHAAWWSP